MKKIALQLTLAALILFCGNGYTQKITLGVKGGFSIPNLTGGSSQNPLNNGYTSRLGGDGSIYGEYHLNKKFSVTFGLEYSSQGGLKKGFQAFPNTVPPPTYLYANFKSEAKLDYLLVPVLARYTWKINKKSPFRIYASVGPFAGYLLDAKQVTSGSSDIFADAEGTMKIASSQSFDNTTNIKSQLYTFNVGIQGFAGTSYTLNKRSAVFIEGGGNYGFMSIQKGTANGKNYTGAGEVTVGFAYTIQQKYNYRGNR